MKKMAKLFIPVMILVVLAMAMALVSSAATTNVVYVSSAGTGDGSTPDSPLGNTTGYAVDTTNTSSRTDQTYKGNALYLAFDHIAKTGTGAGDDWTIVLVGQTIVDCANELHINRLADMVLPSYAGKVTVTSVYGGVDYRTTKSAELVFDHRVFRSPSLRLGCATVWENINITTWGTEAVMESAVNQEYGAYFNCAANETVFGEGITTTTKLFAEATSTSSSTVEEYYPTVFGGTLYNTSGITGNPTITIKSGKWSTVAGALQGNSGNESNANHHFITGNVSIRVEGGEIAEVFAVTSDSNWANNIYVNGDATITIIGGKVGKVYGLTSEGVSGKLTINIGKYAGETTGASVGEVIYSTAMEEADAKTPTAIAVSYEAASVTTIDKTTFPSTTVFGTSYTEQKPVVIPPTQNPPVQNPPQTGSALVWLGAIAVVSIVGTCVAISKKETAVD